MVRFTLRGLVRLYQLTLSALMGRTCRYGPSCSDYADQAIARHGAWAGLWMALARLSRCHPFGGNGFDPVPDQADSRAVWYLPWRYGHWRMPPAKQD